MENVQLKLLSYVAELSALFHDLGKATDGFQIKLRSIFNENDRKNKNVTTDPVRHELLSVFIAAEFFADVQAKGWHHFSNPLEVAHWFRANATVGLSKRRSEYLNLRDVRAKKGRVSLKGASEPFEMARFEKDTLSASILWLVLTHHRLPVVGAFRGDVTETTNPRLRIIQKQESGLNLTASVSGYVNTDYLDRVDRFFTISNVDAPGLPWNNMDWCRRVSRIIDCIDRSRAAAPDIRFDQPSSWVTGMMYLARPAVVFGDHRSSSRKERGDSRSDSPGVFANTMGTIAEPWLADRLDHHLIKTEWDTSKYFNVLFREGVDPLKKLPRIDPKNISGDLKYNNAPEPYTWQNHLDTAARETEGRPCLSIIMAQTGTGKTRGCIKLASALSEKGLRCTVGLGLRTLADQTYRDYLEYPISLPKEGVGRMIGNFYPLGQHEEQSLGTGATESDGDTALLESQGSWEALTGARIFSGRRKALLIKPVTAMTIDNIIKAVTVKSGIDTHILMHLMHSDLIVDEIDNFSPADLSFVTVLVHIMGFYGRKVVLATATMNQVTVKAMGQAYAAGIKKRQSFFTTPEPKLALIKSSAPYYQVSDLDTTCVDAYKRFIEDNKGEARNTRHRSRIFAAVRRGGSFFQLARSMRHRIDLLSKSHYEEVDGLQYSTGFVRMNTVKSAQRLAIWLSQSGMSDDAHVEIVCYHSKTTGFERYVQEYFLNNLMKRKGQTLPEDVEALRQGVLSRAREAGKSRVVILILTTNVIEVGRDHCYDWCILEPSSLSSFIQSVGRVLRHRKEKSVSSPNIAVLNAPVKAMDGAGMLWGYPGIETPDLAAGESAKRPGAYRLMDGLVPHLESRARRAGLSDDPSDDVSPIHITQDLLWPALSQPSNKWSMSVPDHYAQLPEHSLNLIRLSDYLLCDGQPAGRRSAEAINAGNVAHKSGYQLAQVLGQKVRFRHSQNQLTLTCETVNGNYNNPWISDKNGDAIPIGQSPDFNESPFLLSHIDRESFIEGYLHRFRNEGITRREIQANLFQVTIYDYEAESALFSRHLGMCQSSLFHI
jgi:CRISPR-associated endonuclease/helicase Cas3